MKFLYFKCEINGISDGRFETTHHHIVGISYLISLKITYIHKYVYMYVYILLLKIYTIFIPLACIENNLKNAYFEDWGKSLFVFVRDEVFNLPDPIYYL